MRKNILFHIFIAMVFILPIGTQAAAGIRSKTPIPDLLSPRDQRASWSFQLMNLNIEASEEAAGDEPYFMMIGFKVDNIADPATVRTFMNPFDHVVQNDLKTGRQVSIPVNIGKIDFGEVDQNMLGVVGAVVIAWESDATPWGTMGNLANDLREAVRQTLLTITRDPLSVDLANIDTSLVKDAIIKNIASILGSSFAFDYDDPIGMSVHTYVTIPGQTTSLKQEVTNLAYSKDDFPKITVSGRVINDTVFTDAVYAVRAEMRRTWLAPDTTPASFRATDVRGNSLTLTWLDRTSNETHFEIENIVTYERIDRPSPNTGRDPTVTAPQTHNIEPNHTYQFHVRACKDAECSGWSNPVTVSTPDSLPSTPATLTSVSVTPTTIQLAWTPGQGNPVTFYRMNYWRNGGGFRQRTYTSAQAGDTWTSVRPGEFYQFHLRACNETGCSIQAKSLNVSVPLLVPLPAAPSSLTLLSQSGRNVTFRWADNSSNEDYFLFERAYATPSLPRTSPSSPLDRISRTIPQNWSGSQVGANSTQYTTTVQEGTITYFQIKACNVSGCSNPSNMVTIY